MTKDWKASLERKRERKDEAFADKRRSPLSEEEKHENDGVWVLDFNESYNPTCAYSERYECPLPPAENRLEVPIEAGEKSYR